jgi:adenine-specific DNA-methyltransferase
MRFIGNKELIISEIRDLLVQKKLITKERNLFEDLSKKRLTFFDAFCGTGAVSDSLKDSFNIVVNDKLNWCVIYTRGRVCGRDCRYESLGFDPFEFFNSNNKTVKGFFYENYSPASSKRMYFTPENAGRIDYFRITIEKWKQKNFITEDEYAHLLASLLESVSVVSNTAGVYGAFLKHWDSRATKKIQFKKVSFNPSSRNEAIFLNSNIEDVVSKIDCDILYLDPPYTQNQYGTQYHLLETLVLYDKPSISLITGSRSTTPMRSDWSKDFKAHIHFDKILAKTKAKYILFSYSQDGFMSKSFIEASLKRYGKPETYLCKKISYRKYTNYKSKEKNDHYEYLFYIERKNESEVVYESPLNYIGSKAKMALQIRKNMPEKMRENFIDAFGGGFNVGINIEAKRIIYNDINKFVCELVASFRTYDTYSYILFIKKIIKRFGLEPENEESYKKVRDFYNSKSVSQRDPKLLFAVILYGFNQQIRFNGNHNFNNPVGMRWFNDKVLEKMVSFSRVMKEKNIEFNCLTYDEICERFQKNVFIYLDPPYFLTNGSYNDGKRGFSDWCVDAEFKFFNFVERLNCLGLNFMLSYVDEHKGIQNIRLQKWIKSNNFRMTRIDPFCGNGRKEILITNFEKNAPSTLRNKIKVPEKI